MTDDTQRVIGDHEARIGRVEQDIHEMRGDLRVIRDTLSEAKGGWRTLLLVAGAGGAAGAMLSKLAALSNLVK